MKIEKILVMDKLRMLKGKEKYSSISITDDNTPKQRKLLKD